MPTNGSISWDLTSPPELHHLRTTKPETSIQWNQKTESDVREALFLGNIEINTGDLSITKEHYPLIDAALSIDFALARLAMDGSAKMNFLGGWEWVRFSLCEDTVEFKHCIKRGTGSLPFISFYRDVRSFQRSLLHMIAKENDGSLGNPFIEYLYRTSGAKGWGLQKNP